VVSSVEPLLLLDSPEVIVVDPNRPTIQQTFDSIQLDVVMANGTLQLSYRFQRSVALEPGWKVYQPPYSMLAEWVPRIIRNAAASHVIHYQPVRSAMRRRRGTGL
jgi:hypothetical protein